MGTTALISAIICLLFAVSSAHVFCGIQGNCAGSVVCPTGYITSGSSCVLSQGISTSSCTGSSCSTAQYSCPQNYVFASGQCQYMGYGCQNTCQQGYALVGNMCHMKSIVPCTPNSCTTASSCQHACYSGQQCCMSQVTMQPQIVCPPTYPTYPPPIYPPPTYPPPTYPPPTYPPPTYPPPTYPPTLPPTYPPTPPPTYPPTLPPTYPPTLPPTYPPTLPPTYPPTYPPQVCMNQTIYVKERGCANITCPGTTQWDGQRCVSVNTLSHNSSVDIKHYINNVNTINSPTNVNIKNDNNVFVYTADERKIDITSKRNDSIPPPPPPPIYPPTLPPPTHPPIPPPPTYPPPPQQPCCIVVTPRVCTQVSSKWACYNRKYSRCGSFCKHPKIYLKPIRPIQRHSFMVVPPQIPCTGFNCGGSMGCSGCQTGGQCGSHCAEYSSSARDCSGCASGGHCSSYCHDYSCGSSCQFYEQQDYCTENKGSPGCFEYDGCYENWCSK